MTIGALYYLANMASELLPTLLWFTHMLAHKLNFILVIGEL
jgi:hypothetical protein